MINFEKLLPENHADLGPALLRVGLGTVLITHGLLKVFVFTPAGTAAFFGSLGVPLALIMAFGTIAFEVLGGALLIGGVATRLISLISIPLMLGAIFFVHGDKGWLFANEGGGWEYPAFLALAALVQFLVGPGKLLPRQATATFNEVKPA